MWAGGQSQVRLGQAKAQRVEIARTVRQYLGLRELVSQVSEACSSTLCYKSNTQQFLFSLFSHEGTNFLQGLQWLSSCFSQLLLLLYLYMFSCSLIFKIEGRYLFSLYNVKERLVDFRLRTRLWQGVYITGTKEQRYAKSPKPLNHNANSCTFRLEQREQNTEQIGTDSIFS